MADPQSLDAIRKGAEFWNGKCSSLKRDLSNADLRGASLSGADFFQANLSYVHLEGADLTAATFYEADLRGAHLEGAHLAGAIFQGTPGGAQVADKLIMAATKGADLTCAYLERADLVGARFGEPGSGPANLHGTYLRESILRDCDLRGVTGGLRPQQLAGADLTGAKLPEPLSKLFENLSAVADISESARKLFIVMLAACLYSWLTIATTTDVNLITDRASSPLPIIQTSIPIVGFYVVAPLLLLCVYFYFHLYLQKLWEELGSLPAVFPDGRRLHERSDPWLLNDLVRSHVPLLRGDRPFMSYFQQAISIVLAWWLVPLTLLMFWGRYLPRHDLYGTTLQAVLIAVSITAAVFLRRLAGTTLRGAERRPFSWTGAIRSLHAYSAAGTLVANAVAFMLFSVGAVRGAKIGWSGYRGWVPRAMEVVHYSVFANLSQADVSIKPPNWTSKTDSELQLVKGAQLRVADLRYAYAWAAFLAKADLSVACLRGAYLADSDLRRAVLVGADLSGADLLGANLNGANLDSANLRGAELVRAQLVRAELEAEMTGAELGEANLTGADLYEADLGGAHLDGAELSEANLTAAGLNRADLRGAHLNGATLRGGSLSSARLDGADLTFADFRSTENYKTQGLTVAALKTAKNWDKAYYDDDLVKELGLPPDHNDKLQEEQKRQEKQKGQPAAGSAGTPGSGEQARPDERSK